MSEEHLSSAELGRALIRIEAALKELSRNVAEEQSTQRHRINNLDQITTAHQIRFQGVEDKFTFHGERVGRVEVDVTELQEENRAKARAQTAFLLGLIAEGALLVVSLVLAANA